MDDLAAVPSPASEPSKEVLTHLEQAESALQEQQKEWESTLLGVKQALGEAQRSTEELSRELQDAREEVVAVARERDAAHGERETLQRDLRDAQAELQRLREALEVSRQELSAERADAERHRQRALQLRAALADVHRALFRGDVYELILRACLTITGATRGLYITWRDQLSSPEVRAAIAVQGYPGAQPSKFLLALCEKVRDEQDTIVLNDIDDFEKVPAAEAVERFTNCAVAPVMVLKGFAGIVVVADKPNGPFEEEDLEALLSVGDQASVALENQRLQRELQLSYFATIAMLANAVEAKDPYTHGHCEMASHHARLTAERLGVPEHERSVTCYAALLHDVGKIGVSDGVLHKPGPLLPEERELVRAHVRVGYDLIRSVPALSEVATAVLHHHEWYDGSGYPENKKGSEIPIASRIIAVVDAYGAMTTRRSYKEALPESYALQELQRFSGSQFDPQVVEAFMAVLASPEAQVASLEELESCGLLPVLTI